LERALKLPNLLKSGRDPLVVVVLGPTASGKTALALGIARRFRGEIVNCDSVAMYREFEIGTAKPSTAERAEVPHHLLDCVDPLADVSAGEYARQARQILREIELRNKLRTRAEKCGTEHLHRILRRLDSAAASRIHANDVPKVIRAIEVCLASRRPMTELWRQGREPLRGFRILRLGLNPEREALYARINQRAAKMFDDGLIAETERLLEKYGDQARPLASLGYKQAVQFLRGEMDRESALAAAQQAHRNYAKRQITWFRRATDVHWLAGFGDDPTIQAEGIAIVEREI
jgi:tRNA dimethylallyltransferase